METEMEESSPSSSSPSTTSLHLAPYDLRGWTPDPSLSDDDNYMDAVMLLTRNSKCRQGSMGCILVAGSGSGLGPQCRRLGGGGIETSRASEEGGTGDGGGGGDEIADGGEGEESKAADEGGSEDKKEEGEKLTDEASTTTKHRECRHSHSHSRRVLDSILGASINLPLFVRPDGDGKNGKCGGDSSDVHAEIAALGAAARLGNATDGMTAYVTMPPCRRCFAALTSAGASRIVTRRKCASDVIVATARSLGVDMSSMDDGAIGRQGERIDRLFRGGGGDEGVGEGAGGIGGGGRTEEEKERIAAERKRRKEQRKEGKRKRAYKAKRAAEEEEVHGRGEANKKHATANVEER